MKTTPGKWIAKHGTVYNQHGVVVAEAHAPNLLPADEWTAVREGNARLLGASKSLYNAICEISGHANIGLNSQKAPGTALMYIKSLCDRLLLELDGPEGVAQSVDAKEVANGN